MPGVVEQFAKHELAKHERQRAGYEQAQRIMDQEYKARLAANPEVSPAQKRHMVQDIALQYSNSVRNNVGDRGRGWERIEHPDFETGERRAIRDWSYRHNHELLQTMAASREPSAHERGVQTALARYTATIDKGTDLASMAANTLKVAVPTIEKEWSRALERGASEADRARFPANLEGLNAMRRDMLEKHPEWTTKLPPPINVQEASQRVAEQARGKQMDQGMRR